MTADQATIEYYQREAPRYVKAFDHGHSRHLDAFLDLLSPKAEILELGCGGGRDTLRIMERGFDVDPTDGTPAMAAEATKHVGRPVRVMRFDQLTALARYDAVWAHACLLHAPRADLSAIFAAIHRALRPAGWHFANYKLGDGEGRDLLGRLGNFPTAQWLEELYEANGLSIHSSEQYRGKGADGTVRDWQAITVSKR
ncbi:class I SAM-dependent methyltransferase [Pontixanthobacter aquaemixtae]|uniref:Methyltransferase domain-containing protein n=1 Tax=Pontixanthobacter aquaemixtae TaxID=1958940 RepID=A0A844ZSW1_9SPHN|nr:class I SAM-dependent methyltransferase [Pontixanthobacter aquaemixtae]MXO90574.1 methyltransferase domain-containing protein [Pontixanthobacter aquaemixtae]